VTLLRLTYRPRKEEKERVEELDCVLRQLFGGQVVLPPALRTANDDEDGDEPPVVLECGCGSGVWIERLLSEYSEDCEVSICI